MQRNDLKEFDNGKSKPLGIHRRIACNPQYVKEFIDKFLRCYDEYKNHLAEVLQIPPIDLSDEQISAGIFALDETSISNCTPLRYELKRLTPTSSTCLQADVSGRSTTNASLLEIYCADGSMPFHVMTTKRNLTTEEKLHLAQIDQRSTLLFCDLQSGAFDSMAHSQSLAKIGQLRGILPSLVIQDCPNTHRGKESLETARNHAIHLMTLPHHSSWYLQVPDDLPFATLKSRHYREMKSYRKLNHGTSPDLFKTLDIFLRARRDVLTDKIIKKAFENCGQFPVSARQILLKADRAQQRCGIDMRYKETEELSPVTLQIESARAKLEAAKYELEKLRNLSRRSSGVLEDLVQEQEELHRQTAHEARLEFENRQAAARLQVQAAASLPRPDDPPFFGQINQLNNFPLTAETIQYLKHQVQLMKPVIEFLQAQVKESLDSRSGCYMVNPKLTVTPSDLLAVRQDWLREVKGKIKGIQKLLNEQKELQKCCLDDSCNNKKKKARWILCPNCKRGYCPDHSSTVNIQMHINSCLPPTPVAMQHSTVFINTTLAIHETTAPSVQIITTVTTPVHSPISPIREDDSIASNLATCSLCQLYIPDIARGCTFCQHPGFANPIDIMEPSQSRPQTGTSRISTLSPLTDDLDPNTCSRCQLFVPDIIEGCEFCQRSRCNNRSVTVSVLNSPQSSGESSFIISAQLSPESPPAILNAFQPTLLGSSSSIPVQSLRITVRKTPKVCPGCGISRTLEECSNGHQQCRRCLLNGCHECFGKRRRVPKKN